MPNPLGLPTPVSDAVKQRTDMVRDLFKGVAKSDKYATAWARAVRNAVVDLYDQAIRMSVRMRTATSTAEWDARVSDAVKEMNDAWDLDQHYRISIIDASKRMLPIVTFRDAGFLDDITRRLSLIDDFALAMDSAASYGPTDQGAVYDFLNATNTILRDVGDEAKEVAKTILKVPGEALGSILGSIPWGKIALVVGAVYVGKEVLSSAGRKRR